MSLLNRLVCLPLLLWVSLTAQVYADPADENIATDCIIVIHGMGRTSYSMSNVAEHLQGLGYAVWNQGYPSLSASIEELSHQAIDPGLNYCRQHSATSIHFVTHSLGGILLRYFLQEEGLQVENPQEKQSAQKSKIPELEKIVMLSPPNHGSEIVDELKQFWLFRAIMGPAALQLGTGGFTQSLEPIPGIIGVITGDQSSDPWFSGDIPGPDDGKVSVESAKLAEMADFLVVPIGHTFIMSDESVLTQIGYFFEQGHFQHPEKLDSSDQSVVQ